VIGMKVLVVCDHGNNRSVTIAGQLKYWKHDVLSVGLAVTSEETIRMLLVWCDRVITTDSGQLDSLPVGFDGKHQLWDLGPDVYPRAYNPELLKMVKVLMQFHKVEYAPPVGVAVQASNLKTIGKSPEEKHRDEWKANCDIVIGQTMIAGKKELRERIEKQLAKQKEEYHRVCKLVRDCKSHHSRINFAEGVICGLEIALYEEEVHTVFDKVDG